MFDISRPTKIYLLSKVLSHPTVVKKSTHQNWCSRIADGQEHARQTGAGMLPSLERAWFENQLKPLNHLKRFKNLVKPCKTFKTFKTLKTFTTSQNLHNPSNLLKPFETFHNL